MTTSPEDRLQAALERVPTDADQLALAYRDAAAALGRARSDPAQAWREERLNALVGRAHARLFRRTAPVGRRLLGFVRWGWARRVRDQGAYTAAAAGIFLAFAAAGYLAVIVQPDAAADLLSPGRLEQIRAWGDQGRWLGDSGGGLGPVLAFRLFRHNATLAAQLFAGGVVFGLVSAWQLAENGAALGATWASAYQAGGLGPLASFTAPHGVLEFPAIFLSGGAGLRLGAALLVPGARRRRQALIEEGRGAALVAAGAIGLLGVAALIEGLISYRLQGTGGALVAAAVAAAALGWWLRPASAQTGPEATSRR